MTLIKNLGRHNRAVPARCAPKTVGPLATTAIRVPAEAAVPRRHLGRRHPAVTTGRAPPYLRLPALPPRARPRSRRSTAPAMAAA
jgi:hypothetical protein